MPSKTPHGDHVTLASRSERAYATTKARRNAERLRAESRRSLIRLADAGILTVAEACAQVGYGVDAGWLKRRYGEGHRTVAKLRELAARGAS